MQIITARDIGLAIRNRRRELSLSQERLAERAGVGRQWLIEVERGKATAAVGLVLRLIKALDLRLFAEPRGKRSPGTLSAPLPDINLDDVIARARKPN